MSTAMTEARAVSAQAVSAQAVSARAVLAPAVSARAVPARAVLAPAVSARAEVREPGGALGSGSVSDSGSASVPEWASEQAGALGLVKVRARALTLERPDR
jgi:hypothetical protein